MLHPSRERPRELVTMRQMLERFLYRRAWLHVRGNPRTYHKRGHAHRALPQLEQLETRLAPASYVWTNNNGTGNGQWETATNWTRTGGNPGDTPGWDATHNVAT